MPDTLILLPGAEADIYEQGLYLIERSPEAAARFVTELRAAFERLLRFPRIGRPWPTRNPELRGLRRLTMTTFPLSIFYRAGQGTVEIVRVLHHRRDLPPDLQDS